MTSAMVWSQSLALLAASPTGLPDDRNAFFNFCSLALASVVIITLLWPLNIPLAALAFKIRSGYRRIDMETSAFWWRSTFAAMGLCGLTLVMLLLAYFLIVGAQFPAGLIHLLLFLAYLPAGVWFMFWIFALEDMVEGMNVFLIYLLLPGLPLYLIGFFTSFWHKLPLWILPS